MTPEVTSRDPAAGHRATTERLAPATNAAARDHYQRPYGATQLAVVGVRVLPHSGAALDAAQLWSTPGGLEREVLGGAAVAHRGLRPNDKNPRPAHPPLAGA